MRQLRARVLGGIPDHRDTVPSGGERDRRDVTYRWGARTRSAVLSVGL